MNFERRIVSAETITSAALVPWLARAKALASDYGGVVRAAEELSAPPEIIARIKNAVEAETVSGQPGLAGSSTSVTAFLAQASESSILLRALTDGAVTSAPMHSWLVSSAVGAVASEAGEGASIPLRGLGLTPERLTPFKVASMVTVTRELWEKTSAEGQTFVTGILKAAIAEACDRAMFDRLTTSGTLDTIAAPDGDGIRLAVEQMLSAVHTRAASRLFWALTPAAWNLLATAHALPNEFRPYDGKIVGRPAIVTAGLTGRRIALLDGRAIGANIERFELRASREGTVEMQDAPTNDAAIPAASEMVSLWQSNSIALKAILHLAVQAVRDPAIAFATIADPVSGA